MCDASAAVAVGERFFLVANDEDNVLRLYRNDSSGQPVQVLDLNRWLELEGKSRETDLEGAAQIGTRVYWIGSHGRNVEGKERANRSRLIATDLSFLGGRIALSPVGVAYKTLLADLTRDARYREFRLDQAAGLAPKEKGALNIEGLAATPEGHLLVGFRNPIPNGKALVAPILNPDRIILGQSGQFGDPILLELNGLGIRDMVRQANRYLILAGSYKGGGKFRLYQWSGDGQDQPEQIKVSNLNEYNPEALVVYSHTPDIQILSDDGTVLKNGVPCKKLNNPQLRSFRAAWLRGN